MFDFNRLWGVLREHTENALLLHRGQIRLLFARFVTDYVLASFTCNKFTNDLLHVFFHKKL